MLIYCSTLLSLCSLHIHNNKYKNIFLLIQLLCIYLYTEDYIINNKYVVYKHLYAQHPSKPIFAAPPAAVAEISRILLLKCWQVCNSDFNDYTTGYLATYIKDQVTHKHPVQWKTQEINKPNKREDGARGVGQRLAKGEDGGVSVT